MEAKRWRLDGLVALITGSTKGIGLACAEEFLQLGASVVITGRSQENVDEVVRTLQGRITREKSTEQRVEGISGDLSNPDDRKELIAFIKSSFGKLDCLVNNAGTNVRSSIEIVSWEEYQSIVGINMDACYFMCKDALALLKQSSRPTITMVSSVLDFHDIAYEKGAGWLHAVAGVGSTGSGSVYAMTKAAVEQLSKALCCELAKYKIRVNCVAPWVTATELFRNAIKNNPEQISKVSQLYMNILNPDSGLYALS